MDRRQAGALQWLVGVPRYFTVKDLAGRPRWLWTGCLCAVIGALVAAAFASGVLFTRTDAFEHLKLRVRALADSGGRHLDAWRRDAGDTVEVPYADLESTLESLQLASIPLGDFYGNGGGLLPIDGSILFVTPKGRFGVVREDRRAGTAAITFLEPRVPIRLEDFEQSAFAREPLFNRAWIRTMDLAARPRGRGRYDLYVSHNRYDDECFRFVVSRADLVADREGLAIAGPFEPVFEAEPCMGPKREGNLFSGLRDGGALILTGRGTLLISIGDYDYDGNHSDVRAAQSGDVDLGKIHELDLATGQSRILARGLRNPQGLVLTRDGVLFESEHGPNGGDEINIIEPEGNYGWPDVSLGMGYGFPRRPWPLNRQQGRHDGYTVPEFAFLPSIAVGALEELTGDHFPLWQGDLLLATLENQALWRLRREGREIVYAERIEIGERIRDIAELPDGRVAMLTDSSRLLILQRRRDLKPGEQPLDRSLQVSGYEAVRAVTAQIDAERVSASAHAGQILFDTHCSSCHAVHTQELVAAPHLYGVIGRRVGSLEGFPYSQAMTGRDEVWSEERLRRYLNNPDAEFAGSNMPRVKLTYPEYLDLAWWITNCTAGRSRPNCHRSGD